VAPTLIKIDDVAENTLRDPTDKFVEVEKPAYCDAGNVSICVPPRGSLRIAVFKGGVRLPVPIGGQQ
jgi:hypothetical protein